MLEASVTPVQNNHEDTAPVHFPPCCLHSCAFCFASVALPWSISSLKSEGLLPTASLVFLGSVCLLVDHPVDQMYQLRLLSAYDFATS